MGKWIRKSMRALRAFVAGHLEPGRAAMRVAADTLEWLGLALALTGAHGWSVLAHLVAALLRVAAGDLPARLVRRLCSFAGAVRERISTAIKRWRRR